MKAINKKIGQNKADLNRQTGKISAVSTRNVSKYEFLTSKHALPAKELLQKALEWKDLNILCQAKNRKSKLVLQNNGIKNLTMLLNIIKGIIHNKKQKKSW